MIDMRKPLSENTIIVNGQDHYRILSLIGRGGSALIYRAEKKDANEDVREVVLKEIYPIGGKFSYTRNRKNNTRKR